MRSDWLSRHLCGVHAPELAGVTGALSRLCLCAVESNSSADLHERTEAVKRELEARLANDAGSSNLPMARVLVNLEYLVKTAWLGGDTWKPQGFVLNPAAHPSRFDVEIVAVATPEGIQIQVLHQNTPGAEELAGKIGSRCVADLSEIIQYVRQVREAEQFWCAEFGPPLPQPAQISEDPTRYSEDLPVIDCEFENFGSSSVAASDYVSVLTAYVIVLARAAGQNFVDVAVKTSASQLLPLRLTIQNHVTFKQFRAIVEEALSLARRHGQYSRAVLRRFTTPEVVRYGLLAISEQDRGSDVRACIRENGLQLALVLNPGGQPGLHLIHKESFGAEYAASLSSWLSTLLRHIARNEDTQLEELLLAPEISDAIEIMTQTPELEENFHF